MKINIDTTAKTITFPKNATVEEVVNFLCDLNEEEFAKYKVVIQ